MSPQGALLRRLTRRAAQMDKERQVYGLKEPTLAELIAQSLGATKGQEKHAQLLGWRKSGSGNFADNVQQARGASRAVAVAR